MCSSARVSSAPKRRTASNGRPLLAAPPALPRGRLPGCPPLAQSAPLPRPAVAGWGPGMAGSRDLYPPGIVSPTPSKAPRLGARPPPGPPSPPPTGSSSPPGHSRQTWAGIGTPRTVVRVRGRCTDRTRQRYNTREGLGDQGARWVACSLGDGLPSARNLRMPGKSRPYLALTRTCVEPQPKP